MQKKFGMLVVCACIILAVMFLGSWNLHAEVKVMLDGKEVKYDTPAQLMNKRTMVPIRLTMEKLGADIEWSHTKREVKVFRGEDVISLTIGEKEASKNGEIVLNDAAPVLKGKRTLVPLRFLSENFGYGVDWDHSTRTVFIDSDGVGFNPYEVDVPVLMYHHLENGVSTGATIDPVVFESHMKAIHNKGYNTITDHDLVDYLERGKKLPDQPILITFDDGYRSNYDLAYPILKELGMKASINLIASRMSNDVNAFPNEIPKMTWDQSRDSLDVFTFQGHTWDSHYKGKTAVGTKRGVITERMYVGDKLETQASFENRLRSDLSKSKEIIEKELDVSVVSIAYPYGNYSRDTIRIAEEVGYKIGFTTKNGDVSYGEESVFELKRINGHGKYSADDMINKIEEALQ
ncbi:polysaccharide deacetylase family protein [Halobacillus sp. A1]|uniref:stalk domain-containing protein n=1 Tax=Halobacillus sp. A1 TaxID=2880262 RepID=UPI0020A6C841|nr:polysaccharide deacetylase family protein [Halobacillus sp. A1]